MYELMERVEEYMRLEDDWLQAKSKSKALAVKRNEVKVDYPPPQPRSDFDL